NLSLARREADLAVRLGRPDPPQASAQRLGDVPYAVYAAVGRDPDLLPWAGLDHQSAHLPEARWTARAAGRRGVEHKASRFEALARMAAAGAVRALLPHLVGDDTAGLIRVGRPAVLAREAWLIGHPGDAAAPHVRAAREWIAAAFARRVQDAG
ncbi:MAG: LysR family transcriptional regulator, partial [Alphaproteobacteria bacterium]|nr:LysR family transcriptional regulator [Alphaproteobacteria bacterium]